MVKNLSASGGDVGLIHGWGNTLEKEMTTHSSIFAWKIPRTEEPGGLQSAGSQKSRTWFNDWERAYQDHRLPNLSLVLWWCLKNFLWVHRIKMTCIKQRKTFLLLTLIDTYVQFFQILMQQWILCTIINKPPIFIRQNLLLSIFSKNFVIYWQYPLDHGKSKRVPGKHLFLLYWLCQSLWLCGSQQTVENSERDGNTRPPDLPLEKSIRRSGSNS